MFDVVQFCITPFFSVFTLFRITKCFFVFKMHHTIFHRQIYTYGFNSSVNYVNMLKIINMGPT